MTKPTSETERLPGSSPTAKKPRLAFATATCLGTGYLPGAPGTLGSVVGILIAMACALFLLRPSSPAQLFSWHPLSSAILSNAAVEGPGVNLRNSTPLLPLLFAFLILVILIFVGVWSASRVVSYTKLKDPRFVVIDEVSGQHLTLLLPLIPIALPHFTQHFDFTAYAIFFALSLLNWKYLLLGFLLFRLFDIWKPYPIRRLEQLPGGLGIMADDWLAGVYAAILLRLALHFNLV
jgi:phosphatidylglycerophosphatase A